MEEHAKWYPTCQQVLIAKSKTYIKKVKAGESQKADEVIERKEPEMKTEDPLTVSLQTLAEFKYSESKAKIALNIFKKRNDVMNECNDNSDPTASQVEPTTQDAEDIDDIEALEEENKKMKEAISCKTCKDREVDTVFRFCGHR
ncbi:BIRC7-like protein, partial [Mya arenaria]